MNVKAERPVETSTLWQLIRYFLKLGSVGFGGPIALAGYMERDLVERRRWFTKTDYVQGLALAELAPGPLAAQLAIYLGYVHSGIVGATAVAVAFIIPSFLMVLAISVAYVRFDGLRWMQAIFYGVGAAVMGIIARSAYKLAKKTVSRKRLLWIIFAVAAVVTGVTRREIISLFVLSGLIAVMAYAPPKRLRKGRASSSLLSVAGLAPGGLLVTGEWPLMKIFLFFAKAGAMVFGSGLAIVPFLYGGVVHDFHWLSETQFLDAVAVAMITPGPVVITVAFIGFLVAGFPGAFMAAFGVFLPVYLFVIIPAGWFRRHGEQPQISAFVEGVTAAAVGALAGAATVIARGAIRDVTTAFVALVTLGLLVKTKIPEPVLVIAAGVCGIFLYRG